jgi:hypothetical protein
MHQHPHCTNYPDVRLQRFLEGEILRAVNREVRNGLSGSLESREAHLQALDVSENTFSMLAMESQVFSHGYGPGAAASCSSVGSSACPAVTSVGFVPTAAAHSAHRPSDLLPADLARKLLGLDGSNVPAATSNHLNRSPSPIPSVRQPYHGGGAVPSPRTRTPPASTAATCADFVAGQRTTGKRWRQEPCGGDDGGVLEEWSVGPGVPFLSLQRYGGRYVRRTASLELN